MTGHWRQSIVIGRKASARRRGRCLGLLAAAAVGVAGVAISLFLFLTLRHREFLLADACFRIEAEQCARSIEQAMSERLIAVRMLQAFYRGSEVVERDEFREFTAPLFERRELGLRALFWVPRVPAAERQAHEQAGQAAGMGTYRIWERSSEGQPAPAGDREVYWPIFYIEPFDEYRDAWGLDLGKETRCAAAFGRVIQRGLPTIMFSVPVEPEKAAPCGFCVLAPVFVYDDDPETRPTDVQGLVGGVFRLDMIARHALTPKIEPDCRVVVLAEVQPGDWREMVNIGGPSAQHSDGSQTEARAGGWLRPETIRFEHRFDLAGTGWKVVVTPRDEQSFIAAQRTWMPFAVLLSGGSLSGLLVGYLLLLGGRTGRIERLVAQRSEELNTISDAALDAVIMMDSTGCVVHWNPAAERIFGYSREEVLGRAVHELLVPPQYRQRAREGLAGFFRSGRGAVVGKVQEMQALRKDGTEFPVEISVSAIRHRNQWWAVAVVRDVSERHRAAEQLRKEQRLLREMLDLQERERRLVAYEIHDGLAQMLTGAQFKLQAVQEKLQDQAAADSEARELFEQGLQLLTEGLVEARRLISGLRPPILDQSGVVAAIDYLIEETRDRGGPEVEFVADVRFERLAPPLESALFRVVQETLNNARRHSRSLKVRIELHETDGRVRLVVQDWGVGFDPKHVDPSRFGLRGIRERARLLGGTATIDSAPGQGTRIVVELPLVTPAEHRASDMAPHAGQTEDASGQAADRAAEKRPEGGSSF